MLIRERKIRAAVYLLFSIYMLINVCFSLYSLFWVRILSGFICLVAGIAVMPLKRQLKTQEATPQQLKYIYFTVRAGDGILVLTLLMVLFKTFTFMG